MTDRLIIADASRVSGADFFHHLMGTTPRDRSLEAAYHEALNAHFAAAKARSDAITAAGPREGESRVDFLIRALEPIYADQRWAREQARLFARGQWMPCEMRDAMRAMPSAPALVLRTAPLRVAAVPASIRIASFDQGE